MNTGSTTGWGIFNIPRTQRDTGTAAASAIPCHVIDNIINTYRREGMTGGLYSEILRNYTSISTSSYAWRQELADEPYKRKYYQILRILPNSIRYSIAKDFESAIVQLVCLNGCKNNTIYDGTFNIVLPAKLGSKAYDMSRGISANMIFIDKVILKEVSSDYVI